MASAEKNHRIRLKKYSLTAEEYDALIVTQENCCAICKKPFGEKRALQPVIDHCHVSGKVRGILHSICNMALGAFYDNKDVLEEAIKYLEKH